MVEYPQVQSFLGLYHPRGKDKLFGSLQTHYPRQQEEAAKIRCKPEAPEYSAKLRIGGTEHEITGQRQVEAGAKCLSPDCSDHGLLEI